MKRYLRFLSRNKLYTAIEVIGLSVSLAFVIIIGCYAWDMYTMTWSVPDHEDIYALNGPNFGEASMEMYENVDKIPEVQEYTAYNFSDIWVEHEEGMFSESMILVGKNFFDMFPMKTKAGETGKMADDGTVVISESLAKKMFGKPEEAVGKTMTFNRWGSKENPEYSNSLQVKAVIEDLDNTVFLSAGVIMNLQAGERCGSPIYRPQVFVKTDGSVTREELSEKVKEMIKDYCTEAPHYQLEYSYAHPFDGLVLFHSHNGLKHTGVTLLMILAAIAVILLFCAILNYINLSFAQTAKRSNEIATMRLVGAQKGEILRKHLTESLLMSATCTILAILLIAAITPVLNSFISSFDMPYEIVGISLSWRSLPLIAGIALVTGLISGIVPAGLAMSFSPIEVTKGRFRKMRKMVFSRIFIGINSVIAVILMMIAITLEMSYLRLKDAPTSWNSENMLFMSRQYGNARNDEIFRERLETLPYVKNIGGCSDGLAEHHRTSAKDLEGNNMLINICHVDSTTFRMMGLTQVHSFNVPLEGSVWYSESALKRLGKDVEGVMNIDPGMIFRGLEGGHSAGVIKDFSSCDPLSHSMHPESILIVRTNPYAYNYVIETIGQHKEVREAIQSELEKYCLETRGYYDGTEMFGYTEEFIARSLLGIKTIVMFVSLFLFIALLIAVVGMAAMSSYFAGENTKGIAIHKVFGGTVQSETTRNIRKFMRITIIANIIGLPIGYFIAGQVFQGIPMVDRLWPLILTGFLTICISLASVLWQTLRAARTNPAEALKKE